VPKGTLDANLLLDGQFHAKLPHDLLADQSDAVAG
jgi:hypothetical protein